MATLVLMMASQKGIEMTKLINGKTYYSYCGIITKEDNNNCPTGYGHCQECPHMCFVTMQGEKLEDKK